MARWRVGYRARIAACARRSDLPLSNLGEDDDAICRANNVAPGSPAYVACIKDRDAQHANAASRADQRHTVSRRTCWTTRTILEIGAPSSTRKA